MQRESGRVKEGETRLGGGGQRADRSAQGQAVLWTEGEVAKAVTTKIQPGLTFNKRAQ